MSGPQPRAAASRVVSPAVQCHRRGRRALVEGRLCNSRSGCSPATSRHSRPRSSSRPARVRQSSSPRSYDLRGDVDRPVTVGEHLVDSSRVGVVWSVSTQHRTRTQMARVVDEWDDVVAPLLHPVVLSWTVSGVSRMLGSHVEARFSSAATARTRASTAWRAAHSRGEYSGAILHP